MKPVRIGDRGPAVEDIQRRLRTLGYDLGPTGIDGVFFGHTSDAVSAFKADQDLAHDSVVDDDTWSALVDATFTLGDRMLYLRAPHFHGRDVLLLQEALNALGFACGAADGIFGTFTERAVREFQRNAGLVPDGIAGVDSVKSVLALRHVWEGKGAQAHSAAKTVAARACEGLEKTATVVSGLDPLGRLVAERVANLAAATNPHTRLVVTEDGVEPPSGVGIVLRISGEGRVPDTPGHPIVSGATADTLESRLLTALESVNSARPEVIIELSETSSSTEHELQRAAVRLLDALCGVFD